MIAALGSRVVLSILGGAALLTLVALGWAHYRGLKADLAEARAGLVVATEASAANAEAARMLTAQIAANDRAIRAAQAAAARARADLNTIREEIRRAPNSDDGPVAPVLARTLERLRAVRDGGDAGRDGAGDGAGQPAGLP